MTACDTQRSLKTSSGRSAVTSIVLADKRSMTQSDVGRVGNYEPGNYELGNYEQ
jgi:hypothetical protein